MPLAPERKYRRGADSVVGRCFASKRDLLAMPVSLSRVLVGWTHDVNAAPSSNPVRVEFRHRPTVMPPTHGSTAVLCQSGSNVTSRPKVRGLLKISVLIVGRAKDRVFAQRTQAWSCTECCAMETSFARPHSLPQADNNAAMNSTPP